MNHMQLLREISRLEPRYPILDTSVLLAYELPVMELRDEDSDKEEAAMNSSNAASKMIMVGSPDKQATKLMLTYIGFDFNFYDWHNTHN